jgi:ribose transport system ATP-binding protein
MAPTLDIERISKTFAGRRVLHDASVAIAAGEVRGLVGQNGSGKSTLIKILSGVHAPDPGGRVRVLGREASLPLSPGDPARLGMSFVHQDLGLFEDGSVLDNLRIGRYQTGFGWRIRWRAERQACREELDRFGIAAAPETQVRSLSQIDRALLAIVRAVDRARAVGQSGVLILDEPTSYLPRDGVDRLFAAVRELKAAQFGILFVSHRIDEVLALCDAVTVLRDGHVVDTLPRSTWSEEQIVAAMLGRSLEGFYPEQQGPPTGGVLLSAHGVAGDGVDQLSVSVRAGEILGVTGLLGMGQERLPYLLFGAARARGGELEVDGARLPLARLTTRRARGLGLALLPADRLRLGGVQLATAKENVTLGTLGRYARWGRLQHGDETAAAQRLLEDFAVAPPEPSRQLRTFSGGNQQKTLLAKWLTAEPRVLLLHEPTQGVDVGAKQQIFRHIRSAADRGTAVLLASTEYEDLAGICDRVVVLSDGRQVAELQGAGLTHEQIVEACYRTKTQREVTK